MVQEKMIRLRSGSIILHFTNEDDYKVYQKETKRYNIYLMVTIGLMLLGLIGTFVFLFNYNFIMLSISVALVAIGIGIAYVFNPIYDGYHQYLFNLVITEIKRNKYRITHSNNKTGHISYVKDGVGQSIYVFKGKNAKG